MPSYGLNEGGKAAGGRLYLADVILQRELSPAAAAMSISGRLESAALCQRRSFWQ